MARQQKSEMDKEFARLERVLSERYRTASGIRREGTEYILPEKSNLDNDIQVLQDFRDSENEIMDTNIHLDAHPDDALFAVYSTIADKFGALNAAMTLSFFGTRPGEQRTINIGVNKTMVVPVGKAEIFGNLPITLWVQPYDDKSNDVGGYVDVMFRHPRKWEPLVKEIEDAIRSFMVENSIFRNKAINSDFSFLDLSRFDPKRRVVYSQLEREKLGGEVFAPIVAKDEWLANGGTLKRGVLLYGDYGTGKSLTMMLIAKLCEQHNWTFINVKSGDSIARVLRFAKRYQPAVVAVEDIDRQAGRQRTDDVNTVVNQFDDVVTKDDQVMVIMTTNNRDQIQPAMLRPGRIDTSIQMGVLDAESVRALVENELRDQHGESVLDGELNAEELFEAAKGYTNAYVVEGVRRAKGYALMREYETHDGNLNGNGRVRITNADIVGGLHGLRDQWTLMKHETQERPPQIDARIGDIVDERLAETMKTVNELAGKVGIKKAENNGR